MATLANIIAKHKEHIVSHHEVDNKFVASVTTHETKEAMLAELPKKVKAHIIVQTPFFESEKAEEATGDVVDVLYNGTLPIASMQRTGFGKKDNPQFFPAFVRVFEENEVFEPIILSKDLTIIDGEQRLAAIAELNLRKDRLHRPIDFLPAIVLNTTEVQAKFLRLVLNKSNEFQRWHWDEIDVFLEEHLEFLPQLEPLAIFGERVLPESFFGNTVTGYEIHAEEGVKSQQSFYKQEHGLARWAKEKRLMQEEEDKLSRTAVKAATRKRTTGLDFTQKGDV